MRVNARIGSAPCLCSFLVRLCLPHLLLLAQLGFLALALAVAIRRRQESTHAAGQLNVVVGHTLQVLQHHAAKAGSLALGIDEERRYKSKAFWSLSVSRLQVTARSKRS
eukprot:3733587-Pleurochrysis_carterae.AAC.1